MHTTAMSPVESAAIAPKILEISEKRRRARELLAQRPRFRTPEAALFFVLAIIGAGAGIGLLAFADLGTYRPEVGRLWIYIASSIGGVTGCFALARAVFNTRRLDAISTLMLSDEPAEH
jgi:hypothetical protein